jgi:hypothetical protein
LILSFGTLTNEDIAEFTLTVGYSWGKDARGESVVEKYQAEYEKFKALYVLCLAQEQLAGMQRPGTSQVLQADAMPEHPIIPAQTPESMPMHYP